MQATFQLDLNNVNEVTELKELLERRLSQLLSQQHESDNSDDLLEPFRTNANDSTPDNILILLQFVRYASENQLAVLKWMKANPGSISAHILKRELPFLAPQGALPGVFRPGRWVKISGGTKSGFPFLQIDWNREEGCGIYRGLTQEEANALDL